MGVSYISLPHDTHIGVRTDMRIWIQLGCLLLLLNIWKFIILSILKLVMLQILLMFVVPPPKLRAWAQARDPWDDPDPSLMSPLPRPLLTQPSTYACSNRSRLVDAVIVVLSPLTRLNVGPYIKQSKSHIQMFLAHPEQKYTKVKKNVFSASWTVSNYIIRNDK